MNIRTILQELNISTAPESHTHSRAGWLQVDCPFCYSPGHYRLGINLEHLYCNCWSCGGQNLINVLMEASGKSYPEIQDLLQGIVHEKSKTTQEKKGTLQIPKGVGDLLLCHRIYLSGRGFSPDELVRFWDIKGIGLAGSLAWRVWIPIIYRGEIVSWTTRTIGEHNPMRYVTADTMEESIPAKTLLYGEDYVRHSIIVCEGCADVWKIGPGAVATMGTSYTQEQVLKMSVYPQRVICFDSEPDAQSRARKLARSLKVFPGETIQIMLESGKDAGDADREEIQEVREKYLV